MWKIGVFLLCVTACTEQDKNTSSSLELNTGRVSIIKSGSGFEVSVEHGPKLLERWRVGSLVMDLGQVVGDKLSASPHNPKAVGVIFCGGSQVEYGRLQEVASGLPKDYDVVTCMPDRKNCPGSCPK